MNYLADIKILSVVVDKLLQYSDKHKVRVNDAITAISKAWNFTYDYLYNQKGEIVIKTDLADLWNEAADKTRLVNPSLGRKLKEKGRFWIHPNLPRQNRILRLKEITDEIERLEKKLR